jgi:hypothetical protein
MRKAFFFFLSLAAASPAFAQSLQPGEWEFNAVTSSPLFPGGQSKVFRHCVSKEDADDPERWMARRSEKSDCKLTPVERTANSMKWQVSCAKTNIRGDGVAWLTGPASVESELRMTTEFQGYRVETNTRTTGRRLGPCSERPKPS